MDFDISNFTTGSGGGWAALLGPLLASFGFGFGSA